MSQSIAGYQVPIAGLPDTGGKADQPAIQQWVRDVMQFIETGDWFSKFHSVFFHRVIGATSSASVAITDSRFDASLSSTLGSLQNNVAQLVTAAGSGIRPVFNAIVFVRTTPGGIGPLLTLDVDTVITVDVDDTGAITLSNTTGSSVTCFVLLMFFDVYKLPTPQTPVIS